MKYLGFGSGMALGWTQANETLNYLGKLSGNCLISGTCLAADGIPGFASGPRASRPSVCTTLYKLVGYGRCRREENREREGERERETNVVRCNYGRAISWLMHFSRVHIAIWIPARYLGSISANLLCECAYARPCDLFDRLMFYDDCRTCQLAVDVIKDRHYSTCWFTSVYFLVYALPDLQCLQKEKIYIVCTRVYTFTIMNALISGIILKDKTYLCSFTKKLQDVYPTKS